MHRDRKAAAIVLRVRPEEKWLRRLTDREILNVARHADDLNLRTILRDTKTFSQSGLVGPHALSERSRDHRHRRGVRIVRLGKRTSLENRQSPRREIFRRHDVVEAANTIFRKLYR